jgi:hypothetical protein
MSELLDLALEAHGGLERWRDVQSLDVHVSLGKKATTRGGII